MCLWTRTNAIELVSTYICILRVHNASTGKLVYVSSLYAQVEFLPAVFFTSNNNQPIALAYYGLSCVCVCLCGRGGGGGRGGAGGCMASERASVSPKWIDFEVRINWQSRKCDNNPCKSKLLARPSENACLQAKFHWAFVVICSLVVA